MNQLIRMNAKTYAERWHNESTHFDRQKLYMKLAQISPKERVLEIGCGNGLGTKQLASNQSVLVIENNPFLLQKAKDENSKNPNITFIEADIFDLSPEDVELIQDFSPEGVVAWMIGSDPDMQENHTPPNIALTERPKLYREAIEDLLVIEPICTPSVKWIHLANRVGVDIRSQDQEIKNATREDYNNYMFVASDFKVSDIQIIDWSKGADGFMYAVADNPNFKGNNTRSCVISILASKK